MKAMRQSFDGLLSGNASVNPHLYNWNFVYMVYCDGGGYAGTRGKVPLPSQGGGNQAIYLDGVNVFNAVFDGE